MTFPIWPGNGTVFLRDFLFFSWAMVNRDHVLGHGALAMGVVIVGGWSKYLDIFSETKYMCISLYIWTILLTCVLPFLSCLKNKRKKKINLPEWKYNIRNRDDQQFENIHSLFQNDWYFWELKVSVGFWTPWNQSEAMCTSLSS